MNDEQKVVLTLFSLGLRWVRRRSARSSSWSGMRTKTSLLRTKTLLKRSVSKPAIGFADATQAREGTGMNTDKDERVSTNDLLQTAVGELRGMRVRAAAAENREFTKLCSTITDGESKDEQMHHEWLLGRCSGISEALACVEYVANSAGVD